MAHTTPTAPITSAQAFLDDVAMITRAYLARNGDDAPITRHLSDGCLDGLHEHLPYLATLAARVDLGRSLDRRAAQPRPYDPMTMLDYPISEETRLAEAAYEAAVRAAVLGHRHPTPGSR